MTLSTLWKIKALIHTKLGFASPVLSLSSGGRLPVDCAQSESHDSDAPFLKLQYLG